MFGISNFLINYNKFRSSPDVKRWLHQPLILQYKLRFIRQTFKKTDSCVNFFDFLIEGDHSAHTKLGLWVLAGLLSFMLVEKVFPDGAEGDDDEDEHDEYAKVKERKICYH